MNATQIAEVINNALGDHSVEVFRKGPEYAMTHRKELFAARVQLIASIVKKYLPAQDPVPQGEGPASIEDFTFKLVIEAVVMNIEAGVAPNTGQKVLDKFENLIKEMVIDFKRAVRTEAMEEFTAGANEADNRLAATLKETGK